MTGLVGSGLGICPGRIRSSLVESFDEVPTPAWIHLEERWPSCSRGWCHRDSTALDGPDPTRPDVQLWSRCIRCCCCDWQADVRTVREWLQYVRAIQRIRSRSFVRSFVAARRQHRSRLSDAKESPSPSRIGPWSWRPAESRRDAGTPAPDVLGDEARRRRRYPYPRAAAAAGAKPPMLVTYDNAAVARRPTAEAAAAAAAAAAA